MFSEPLTSNCLYELRNSADRNYKREKNDHFNATNLNLGKETSWERDQKLIDSYNPEHIL